MIAAMRFAPRGSLSSTAPRSARIHAVRVAVVQRGDAFGLQHPKKIRRRAFHSARASILGGKF
jgi:hypothetical protein